jgi:hypothetical protein
MARFAPSTFKKCVTCEFWSGARVTSTAGREVKYNISPSDGDTGICGNKTSTKKGRPMRGGDPGCIQWIKWSILK